MERRKKRSHTSAIVTFTVWTLSGWQIIEISAQQQQQQRLHEETKTISRRNFNESDITSQILLNKNEHTTNMGIYERT